MLPEPLASLLVPLSLAYGAGVRLRGRLYATGWLARTTLARPVVSVGNLVVGGAGKTPVVAAIAGMLRDGGHRVAVLSRGYGRRTSGLVVVSDGERVRATLDEAGDEPLLLARELPGVAVVVHEERAQAGAHAESVLGAEVHVLDDGFQHLRLARQLDLLVLDATTDHARLRLLPAGPLREPLAAMARAGAVLVTRAHRPHDDVSIRRQVRAWNATAPVYDVHPRFVGLCGRDGQERPLETLRGLRVLALSAIGNPAQFEADLTDLGAVVVARMRWRDHHRYSSRDLARIERAAGACGAEALVTTMKDLVRLEALRPAAVPLLALRMEAVIHDEGELAGLLARVLAEPPQAGMGDRGRT